ncbi:MAG: glycosyltransferase [Anaeroplasmataceae bacterium]|nr:glycosyltransferase [Anaeroplasmataceae bacterium]
MIVLSGGKTGGHIMPLIALAKKMKDVCYVGAYDSLEEKLSKSHGLSFIGLPLKNNHILSILRCFFKLKLKHVDAVIATGGYVSFPVLLYAVVHRIPIYLLEENVILGRTIKFFSHFAKKVFLAYPLQKMKKKYQVVGIPTLTNDLSYSRYRNYSFDVLILGGSLGSKPLCSLVHQLKKEYRVGLVAGRYYEDYQEIKGVTVFPYVEDLPNLMLQAKLIISRSGASTTYEIFTLGKPCILIPSMKTAQNHQYLNTIYFEQQGCCRFLKETEAEENVLPMVRLMLGDKEAIDKMRKCQDALVKKDSCTKIIEEVERT